MNVIIPEKMTARQARSLDAEIRRQCVAKTRQYEYLLDTVSVYVLHTVFGFGETRLRRFYNALFAERKAMQERYEGSDSDDLAEFAMYCKLKDAGIDFKAMFEEHDNEHRFKAKVTR